MSRKETVNKYNNVIIIVMSWEPAWVPDGRGGFRHNRPGGGREEGEEMEESGEVNETSNNNNVNSNNNNNEPSSSHQAPPAGTSLSSTLSLSSSSQGRHNLSLSSVPLSHHDHNQPQQQHQQQHNHHHVDEGEIGTGPVPPGLVSSSSSSSGPAGRSSSFGSINVVDNNSNFRGGGSFRGGRGGGGGGGGGPHPRFGGGPQRDRPRPPRGNFPGGGGGPPFGGGSRGDGKTGIINNQGPFHRGGGGGSGGGSDGPTNAPSFRSSSSGAAGSSSSSSSGGGTGVGVGGDHLPPPPLPPHFRDQHGSNREYRDVPPLSSIGRGGSSGEGHLPSFGGSGPRDFRSNDGPPVHGGSREFSGGDSDFQRGGGGGGGGGEPAFRKDHPSSRDFRGLDRGDPPHRDFRGSGGPTPKVGGGDSQFRGGPTSGDRSGSRDFRSDGHPNRDFRGNDGPLHRDSSFGSGPSLPHRETSSSFGSGDRPPPHRDSSSFTTGPYGPSSSTGNSSSRDGGPPYDRGGDGSTVGRDPPFRDGPPSQRDSFSRDTGPPFRDGPRGEPPFAKRGGEFPYGRGDPSSYAGLGGRDPPNRTGGSGSGGGGGEPPFGSREALRGGDGVQSDIIERTRSVDSGSSLYGGGATHRDSTSGHSEDRGGPHTSFSPRGRDPGGQSHPLGLHQYRMDSRGSLGTTGPPSLTKQSSSSSFSGTVTTTQPGPVAPGRPTDPRRRASKEAGQVGNPVLSVPNEHPDTSIPPFGDGPSTGVHGPHPARRLSSYSSLADSSTRPALSTTGMSGPSTDGNTGAGGTNRPMSGVFRPPVPAVRRAISDQGIRNDRTEYHSPSSKKAWPPTNERSASFSAGNVYNQDHVIPNSVQSSPGVDVHRPPSLQHPRSSPPPSHHHQQSSSLNRPPHVRTGDPRFQRLDDHGAEAAKAVATTGTSSTEQDSTAPAPFDPFGRTRDWQQKPSMLGPRSASAPSRSSPVKNRDSKSSPSSSGGEQLVLAPPRLTSETSTSSSISATSVGGVSLSQPDHAKSKHEQLPPLKLSSLGDAEVVERAKDAVMNFHEVVADSNITQGGEESIGQDSKLPSAAAIMSAVTEIESLVKKTEKESEDLLESIKNVQREEEEQKVIESKLLEAKETERQIRLKNVKIEQREEEERMKAMSLEEAINEGKDRFELRKQAMTDDFEGQLSQAKTNEKTRCDDDMAAKVSEASVAFDKSVAKARRDLEKSKSSAQKIEKKVASAQVALRSRVEIEEKKKKKKRKAPPREFVRVEDVVASIMVENKRKAREAQALSFSMSHDVLGMDTHSETIFLPAQPSHETRDPKYEKTFEEWSILTMQVTGLSDALYSEPTETPFYEQNEQNHEMIGPLVKEYVRDNQRKLKEHWIMLAEEYEVRRILYEKQQRKLAKKARGSVAVTSRKSITGHKEARVNEVVETDPKVLEAAARSNNPYRRARRGDLTVRSEYEQEQIIAEIAAKEAMEKRISHGGSKLPRQVTPIERVSSIILLCRIIPISINPFALPHFVELQELTATYIHTFTSARIDDPMREAEEEALTNIWTDMEKCIFLDRFLQFPKDFRRIASFLRNKSTKDCIAFYYDSKQTVPYKGALKEHMMRRKRKGDYQVYDASIQATTSCGARITAGLDEEKPVFFAVPDSDFSYTTRALHPLKRDVLDAMVIDEVVAEEYEDAGQSEDAKWKSRKRGRDPLFSLDQEQTKFLRPSSQEAMTSQRSKVTEEEASEENNDSTKPPDADSSVSTPVRKPPQKWTANEKKIFLETLDLHGKHLVDEQFDVHYTDLVTDLTAAISMCNFRP